MKTLIQRLLELIESLQPVPGVDAGALRNLLRAYSAAAIQEDPSQANIPPGPIDPLTEEAIRAGAEQAKALNLEGVRMRLVLEDLPLGTAAADAGEAHAETFGPFALNGGRLLRFAAIRSSKFLEVRRQTIIGHPVGDLVLLIPAASAPDAADLRNWTLAPGTVWIGSGFLVAGAPDFAGLRISGGTLRLDRNGLRVGNALFVTFGGTWSLTVQPEAAVGDPAGSDGDALTVTAPAFLEVHSSGAPVVTGPASLSGFGSNLDFTFAGPPTRDGSQISFPMTAAEARWSIGGNRSNWAQFSGEAAVSAAGWTIPISHSPTNQLGEASHGASFVVRLSGDVTSTFSQQQGGVSHWFVATLTANSQRVELDAQQATSGARYDLQLWNTSSTSLLFAQQAISRLLFRSERGAIDTVLVNGGLCRNKWDLPKRADDVPFPFEGTVGVFGILASPSLSLAVLIATGQLGDQTYGLALENLYVIVRSPRRLFLAARFDQLPVVPDGLALLFFDVNQALPTLPDPYAANLTLSDDRSVVELAFREQLIWTGSRPPALQAFLDKAVRFPEPRFQVSDPDEGDLQNAFRHHLQSQPEFLYLLDMSSREHLLGVAMESPSDNKPSIVDNRLAFQMNRVRLLMQPQVQWEPVQAGPNAQTPVILHSLSNGGPTLVGANTVTLVPSLPEPVSQGIIDAIKGDRAAAALFSLPFGLRAMTRLSPPDPVGAPVTPPGAITELHEPSFGDLSGARQVRITARNTTPQPDPSRYIPGMMRQLQNVDPNSNPPRLTSVTPNELLPALKGQFANIVPLHRADLSGYGLSTFSEWILSVDGAGFSKAQFHVLNGRTAYEVLQFRSVLFECGARVVRTVILERHNAGRVYRFDSGWVAVEPGLFALPKNKPFEKGAVRSFQNIRRIRISGAVIQLDANSAVQPVIFDADVEIEGHAGNGLVPIYDRPGYVQVQPPPPAPLPPAAPPLLTDVQLKLLFDRVGAISGPIDCVARIGGTLEMQLSSIVSDVAPDDLGPGFGFAVAVVGTPKLPRAGQWSVTRIDRGTSEVTPVDPRRGTPVVRNGAQPYRFREPGDNRRTSPLVEYGLLMATETSRALFPKPKIDPGQAGKIFFDSTPLVADPYSLVQSTSAFPRPTFALPLKETPLFHVGADNSWRIDNPVFTMAAKPLGDLMKGGEWGIGRDYNIGEQLRLDIDSTAPAPFNVQVPSSDLKLNLPQFPPAFQDIFKISSKYTTVSGGIPKLDKPDIVFSGALEELKNTLHALSQLLGLPFHLDVSVTAGGGASPSFVVHMELLFRVGAGPDGRVEIGVGKFYGQFLVQGELEAALTGASRALLFIEFRGDVQQGIIPPLLYAGGLFRFSIELHETGRPIIQLTLGVVASIGGDLIPGLISLEVTVSYGYTLIPETLEPGVLLGLDARAKLLGGLVGFSFGVEAMARIARADPKKVKIWAQIRVAATVQIAFFIEEDVDFQTQFEQEIPLAALALVPGVGLLPAATAL